MLTDSQKHEIKLHALAEKPKECCGIITQHVHRCRNISDNPEHHFKISPEDYVVAVKDGAVTAFYHSHLENPEFSQFDIQNSELHKLPIVLYCIKTDAFSEYTPQGFQLPYTGRGYIHGKVDCFTLIRDYYANEKNIFITDITHPYRYVEDKKNHPENTKSYPVLFNHFIENNFIEVFNARSSDVLLMKTPFIPSPVHCAIFMNNNVILHHPFQGVSCSAPYSNFWKARTVHIMRHRSLA
jgi:proteasome lid subunit RPN8/RPN11